MLESHRFIEDEEREREERFVASFPAKIVRFLQVVPDAPGPERGILRMRAVVRPKRRRIFFDGKEYPLPDMCAVPVTFYRFHKFMIRPPLTAGDIVQVHISQEALDNLIKDRQEYPIPDMDRIHAIEDAVITSFPMRMDSDPVTPPEALDGLCIYTFLPDRQTNHPIAKFIFTPRGEIEIWCRRFTLHCPEVHLGRVNSLEAVRILVDRDNDTEANGPDFHPSGSKCTFIATRSDYRPGLTEPLFYESPPPEEEIITKPA